ncbi:ABC transporter ATP-binding protein [Amaricoccus solimangrovi]|uniref:ABC transporter ATP-binding protein n=1 Tax=Amaricoccus solimangrovi TaxID=2589815 RepID=A0A501W953_9RHOB|nr:ABC transporter ATP-binding protein [Amaricoccus solimangrovi]TPE45065.1 ABC transporter ATP-binding protein [Amaricoccus solimangrovi]
MIKTYRQMLEVMTPRERRGFYWQVLLLFVVGIFETAGVASVLPFMAVLSEPGSIHEGRILPRLYDGLGFTEPQSFMIFLGLATFCVVMLGIFAQIFALYTIQRFTNARAYSLSSRLLRGYLRQPYAWFLNRHTSDLGKAVLSEVDAVVNQTFMPAMKMISNFFIAGLITALLVAIQPFVALGAAALLLVCYLGIFVTARRWLTHFGKERYVANRERFRIAQEATGGIKDVKLMALEDSYIKRFQGPARRMARANTFKGVVGDAPRLMLQGIAFGGMLLVILVLLITGSGSLGSILPMLAVYAFAGLRLLPAMQQVYNQITLLRFNQPVLDGLYEDLKEIETNEQGLARVPEGEPVHLRERLELRGIEYAYPNTERAALRGLDLAIRANTTVGIVGGTGAGKTTAVDLILGLLDVQKGEMLVDGVPVTKGNLRSWQKAIGYVPQQIFLTDASVAANIAFGQPREKIDMAAVERAARIAELHDFVTRDLPQGYDTLVGERGVRLSGGQRQRIGIARALYADPDVLIMDEATSALDNLTERAVMDAVHNLGRRKTIILIAHRLSTVRACDTIFMLEHGRKIAEGPYDELIDSSRQFRAMAVGHPAE